jgi:hypothetical protein
MAATGFVDTDVDNSSGDLSCETLDTLTDYERRKLSNRCTYPGCDAELADRQCAEHGDRERVRKRLWIAAKREEWRAAKRCTRCGGPRKAGSKWGCAGCIVDLLGFVDVDVDKSARVAAATAIDADNRTRYHGQARRGPPSKASLNAQDFDDAVRLAVRAKAECEYASGPEVSELPRAQRDDERQKAIATLRRVVRHELVVLSRYGEDVSQIAAGLDEDGE